VVRESKQRLTINLQFWSYNAFYCELHSASTKCLVDNWRVKTNLIFDDDISEVFREFAHRVLVCVVFAVANCTGALGQGL
jgi:hypothetical protein